MHLVIYSALILLHIVAPVYHKHTGRPLTPFHSGIAFNALHAVVFVALGAHVWRMMKRKKERAMLSA